MQNLLKEYIQFILEDLEPKDQTVTGLSVEKPIKGVVLSDFAEYATADGLGNPHPFDLALGKVKKSTSQYVMSLTPDRQEKIKVIYDTCCALARQASQTIEGLKFGMPAPQNVGKTTVPVDIIFTEMIDEGQEVKHDIHVKLNDSERLIGLQAGVQISPADFAADLNKTWAASAQYKWLRHSFFQNEYGVSYEQLKDSDEPSVDRRVIYREKRTEFLKFLRHEGLPEIIEKEINDFFAVGQGADKNKEIQKVLKKTFFFKYRTKPDPVFFEDDVVVTLDVDEIKNDLGKFVVVDNVDPGEVSQGNEIAMAQKRHAESTRLYTVVYGSQPVYVIEARSSDHPLQLKVYSSRVKLDSIYNNYQFT